MKEVIRWGILGTGQIAGQFAAGLAVVDDAELYAVAGRSAGKAEVFSRQHRVAHSFGSFEELLAQDNIDVVYVATPHHVHYEHCVMALQAGKPVLCEKPFTINAEQARQLIDLAREKNLFCMEAMWMRFIPAMRKLTELLDDDAIGTPHFLQADFGVPFDFNPKGRVFDPELAGGALLDLGVYPVSLAYKIFGAPVEILTTTNLGESGVDEGSCIILKHAGGQMSTIRCSIRHELIPQALVTGSTGSLVIESPLYRPHKIRLQNYPLVQATPDTNATPSRVKALLGKVPVLQSVALNVESYLAPFSNALATKVIPFAGNGYNYQATAVHECLREGKLECGIMPLDETCSVLAVMDEIREQWGLRYAGE